MDEQDLSSAMNEQFKILAALNKQLCASFILVCFAKYILDTSLVKIVLLQLLRVIMYQNHVYPILKF